MLALPWSFSLNNSLRAILFRRESSLIVVTRDLYFKRDFGRSPRKTSVTSLYSIESSNNNHRAFQTKFRCSPGMGRRFETIQDTHNPSLDCAQPLLGPNPVLPQEVTTHENTFILKHVIPPTTTPRCTPTTRSHLILGPATP